MASSLYFIDSQRQIVIPVRNCTGNPVRTLKSDNSNGYHHNFTSKIKTACALGGQLTCSSEFTVPGQVTAVNNELNGTGTGADSTITIGANSDNALKSALNQDTIEFMHWVVPVTTSSGNPSECIILCRDYPSYSNECPSFFVDPNPDA